MFISIKEGIDNSVWAQQYRLQSTEEAYYRTMEILEYSDFKVEIVTSDETGEIQWAVITADIPDYWIDAFSSKEEAIKFCDTLGLTHTYSNIGDNTNGN